MKRQLKAVSLASCIGLGLSVSGLAVAQEQTLDVATDPSFVPFEMMDQETGEMVGFDMDIIKEISERAGFDYDLRTMDFNGIIPAVQTGNIDIAIAGITITDERAEIVDFSDPYYDSGLKLLVNADDDSIQTVEDLEGKKVGTKVGSTSYDYLEENLGDSADITPYPAPATCTWRCSAAVSMQSSTMRPMSATSPRPREKGASRRSVRSTKASNTALPSPRAANGSNPSTRHWPP